MDSPFIVFDSDYEGRRPKLGQKRCKIGLSIHMKNGAKFRTQITFQKDAIIVNNFPSNKMRNKAVKGAKSDSIHSSSTSVQFLLTLFIILYSS